MLVKTKARILWKKVWTILDMSEDQVKAYWENYVEKLSKEEVKAYNKANKKVDEKESTEKEETLESTKANKKVDEKDVIKK